MTERSYKKASSLVVLNKLVTGRYSWEYFSCLFMIDCYSILSVSFQLEKLIADVKCEIANCSFYQ